MKKVLFTIIVFLMVQATTFAQCAMCRASVSSNLSEGRGMIGTGINLGIIYLLSFPYLLVAALIYLWVKNGRKELAKRIELQNRLKDIYS